MTRPPPDSALGTSGRPRSPKGSCISGIRNKTRCDILPVTEVRCDLPIVDFLFDSDEDVGSFTVTCRLVAAKIREPKTNDLHVKLSVSTAIEPPSPEESPSSGNQDDDSDGDDVCRE